MPVPAVRLKIRVRMSNGGRAYVDPVFSPNGKLKPLYAVINGKSEHHPEGIYHLRYAKGDKRVWHAVGTDAQLAINAKLRMEHKLQSISLGLSEADAVKKSGKTDLAKAIAEYLSDTAKAKSKRTLYAYTRSGSSYLAPPYFRPPNSVGTIYVSPASFGDRETSARVSRKSSTVVFRGKAFRFGRIKIAIRHLGSFGAGLRIRSV